MIQTKEQRDNGIPGGSKVGSNRGKKKKKKKKKKTKTEGGKRLAAPSWGLVPDNGPATCRPGNFGRRSRPQIGKRWGSENL